MIRGCLVNSSAAVILFTSSVVLQYIESYTYMYTSPLFSAPTVEIISQWLKPLRKIWTKSPCWTSTASVRVAHTDYKPLTLLLNKSRCVIGYRASSTAHHWRFVSGASVWTWDFEVASCFLECMWVLAQTDRSSGPPLSCKSHLLWSPCILLHAVLSTKDMYAHMELKLLHYDEETLGQIVHHQYNEWLTSLLLISW